MHWQRIRQMASLLDLHCDLLLLVSSMWPYDKPTIKPTKEQIHISWATKQRLCEPAWVFKRESRLLKPQTCTYESFSRWTSSVCHSQIQPLCRNSVSWSCSFILREDPNIWVLNLHQSESLNNETSSWCTLTATLLATLVQLCVTVNF